jgi:hypothetical protein
MNEYYYTGRCGRPLTFPFSLLLDVAEGATARVDRLLFGPIYAALDLSGGALVYPAKVDTHKSQYHVVSYMWYIESHHVRRLEDLSMSMTSVKLYRGRAHLDIGKISGSLPCTCYCAVDCPLQCRGILIHALVCDQSIITRARTCIPTTPLHFIFSSSISWPA